ncbi:universal stress protein [Advenella alkanexedens]|jgi:nucleotide-binding universal stress UspA family protein|uniref:Universal stress protein n=1 Tax=Advenella alkanexedens TaxID=1481665 RepID=A0ABS6NPD2_9BURK|nr:MULTISPECIES: universal stress protein [Advenella]MBV4397484.1 universal stress protein [Advenella alkanexedens]MDD3756971.1 universal stress protein [Advenella sp.]NLN68801.1 universal stress protein [Alcaligenaceae bacterium]
MYKKILLPIDGSEISAQAANSGICFARQIGAEIVTINVTQPFSTLIGFDGMAASYAISDGDYEEAAKKEAQEYLKPVLERAETAGVKATSVITSNYSVADGIVEAAKEHNCDLIYIASHGRSGLSRLLLGSVTIKVLSLAHTSVLVYRVKESS